MQQDRDLGTDGDAPAVLSCYPLHIVGGCERDSGQVRPPSLAVMMTPSPPAITPCRGSENETLDKVSLTGLATEAQCAPASTVRRISPCEPTMKPRPASSNQVPNS